LKISSKGKEKNSSAEVDYVIAEGASIVPIEVKAGKSGTLKSLHLFLREKHRSLGIRFNSDIPSVLESKTALPDGLNIPYRLLSLPLYPNVAKVEDAADARRQG